MRFRSVIILLLVFSFNSVYSSDGNGNSETKKTIDYFKVSDSKVDLKSFLKYSLDRQSPVYKEKKTILDKFNGKGNLLSFILKNIYYLFFEKSKKKIKIKRRLEDESSKKKIMKNNVLFSEATIELLKKSFEYCDDVPIDDLILEKNGIEDLIVYCGDEFSLSTNVLNLFFKDISFLGKFIGGLKLVKKNNNVASSLKKMKSLDNEKKMKFLCEAFDKIKFLETYILPLFLNEKGCFRYSLAQNNFINLFKKNINFFTVSKGLLFRIRKFISLLLGQLKYYSIIWGIINVISFAIKFISIVLYILSKMRDRSGGGDEVGNAFMINVVSLLPNFISKRILSFMTRGMTEEAREISTNILGKFLDRIKDSNYTALIIFIYKFLDSIFYYLKESIFVHNKLAKIFKKIKEYIYTVRGIYEFIKKDDVLWDAFGSSLKKCSILFDKESNENKKDYVTKRILNLLEEIPTKWDWFKNSTEKLRTFFVLFDTYKYIFIDAILEIADIETYYAMKKFIKSDGQNGNWSYSEFVNGNRIFLEAKDLYGLFINNPIKNNVKIDLYSFILLTGINFGGKTTLMNNLAYCIITSNTFCVAPSGSFKLSPFGKIYTMNSGKTDIENNDSKFSKEVRLCDALLEKIKNNTKGENIWVNSDEMFSGTDPKTAGNLCKEIMSKISKNKNIAGTFSTHYEEPIALEKEGKSFKNFHMGCEIKEGEINFTRKIEKGPAERSIAKHLYNSIRKNSNVGRTFLKKKEEINKEFAEFVHNNICNGKEFDSPEYIFKNIENQKKKLFKFITNNVFVEDEKFLKSIINYSDMSYSFLRREIIYNLKFFKYWKEIINYIDIFYRNVNKKDFYVKKKSKEIAGIALNMVKKIKKYSGDFLNVEDNMVDKQTFYDLGILKDDEKGINNGSNAFSFGSDYSIVAKILYRLKLAYVKSHDLNKNVLKLKKMKSFLNQFQNYFNELRKNEIFILHTFEKISPELKYLNTINEYDKSMFKVLDGYLIELMPKSFSIFTILRYIIYVVLFMQIVFSLAKLLFPSFSPNTQKNEFWGIGLIAGLILFFINNSLSDFICYGPGFFSFPWSFIFPCGIHPNSFYDRLTKMFKRIKDYIYTLRDVYAFIKNDDNLWRAFGDDLKSCRALFDNDIEESNDKNHFQKKMLRLLDEIPTNWNWFKNKTQPLLEFFVLYDTNKDIFINSIFEIAEIETFSGVIDFINREDQKGKWCPVKIVKDVGPYIKAKNFRHPFLTNGVPNSIKIGTAFGNNFVIFNGSNWSGKTTTGDALSLCILYGTVFGVSPSESFTMSPFSKIHTMHSGNSDIGNGESKFSKEVSLCSFLFEKIKNLKGTENIWLNSDEMFSGTDPRSASTLCVDVMTELSTHPNVAGTFSTHFDGPAKLGERNSNFKNVHMGYEIVDGKINYTRKIVEGPSKGSIALFLIDQMANNGEISNLGDVSEILKKKLLNNI